MLPSNPHQAVVVAFLLLIIDASFFLPCFGQDNDGNNDFDSVICHRHFQVDSGYLNKTNALEGLSLRVAVFDYQVVDGAIPKTEDVTSVATMFLDEIASRAGFTWRDSIKVYDSTNVDYNAALYTALNETDLMGEWYTRTIPRLADNIIFPEGFVDASYVLVTRKENLQNELHELNLWSFTQPFTIQVWIMLVGVVFASALTFSIIMKLENTGLGFGDSIFISIFSFTGHFHFNPRKAASRVFSIFVCLFALLIVAIYTANLASFLIVRSTPSKSLETVEDAIKLEKTICTLQNSASSNFFDQKYPMVDYIGTKEESQALLNLDNGICDVAVISLDTWRTAEENSVLNEGCKKEWVGRAVSSQDGGFSMLDSGSQCKSLIRDVLELYMIELKQDGTFDKIWRDFRATAKSKDEKRQNCAAIDTESQSDSDDVSNLRLGLESVGGVFILHVFNMAFTLMLAFGINYYKRTYGKYSTTTRGDDDDDMSEGESASDLEASNTNKKNSAVEEDIVFQPPEEAPTGLDIYGVNFATGNPIHPLENIRRDRRGGHRQSKIVDSELEKRLLQQTKRLEELLRSMESNAAVTAEKKDKKRNKSSKKSGTSKKKDKLQTSTSSRSAGKVDPEGHETLPDQHAPNTPKLLESVEGRL